MGHCVKQGEGESDGTARERPAHPTRPALPALPARLRRTAGAPALALLLALVGLPAHGWDKDRMLAAAQAKGPLALDGARALQTLIGLLAAQPEERRLAGMNRFFNERIRFAEDIETTGEVDQWASPMELLGRGAGDCEDYAIAKYFSLIAAGVPSLRLRLVYVRAQVRGASTPHMVLAYYPQPTAEPLILDNLRPDIQGASQRPDLKPVFSFNAEGLWQGTGTQSAGDPSARLSRWREVIGKARVEGFI